MSRRHSRALVAASRQLQAETKARNAAYTACAPTPVRLDLAAMERAARTRLDALVTSQTLQASVDTAIAFWDLRLASESRLDAIGMAHHYSHQYGKALRFVALAQRFAKRSTP